MINCIWKERKERFNMTQFSELSNEVEDSYMQWKEGKRDQGYYGMKNEASYRNIDLNIPMQRQVDDVQ